MIWFLIVLFIVVASLAYGAWSAAPWVPLRRQDLCRLIELAKPKPGELLFDLGCGDGRIVLAAASKFNLLARGFEVGLLPYAAAKARIYFGGQKEKCQIKLKNFWQTDLSEADIVVCFLTPAAMPRLGEKISKELKPGARFISYAFPVPNLISTEVSKPNKHDISIFLYTNFVRPVGRAVDR